MFVHEDEIKECISHYHSFVGDLEKAAKAVAPKGTEVPAPTEVSCAVMDARFLTPAEVSGWV